MNKTKKTCQDTQLNEVMPHVHYTNPYWYVPRTVWGRKEKGLTYDYHDRLIQYDRKKFNKAWTEATKQCGDSLTAEKIQVYLSLYHGKSIKLKHVEANVTGGGITIWAFGYLVES